ncbi:MAG: DUF4058 family protein [Kamptonema sp. SIO1D9]|nr:DUF4058 family protein [Kamptonema sp. SIO1D9]
MLSPFPGIDPYLENSELWSAVHNRLIVAIADNLVDRLSEKYRVKIEKRTYFSSDEESVIVGIPDVSVATKNLKKNNSQEVNERYLEIKEIGTGTVVTTIELLSPKNKRKGEGRNAYLNKRNQVLASATHLVEIDFLRGGKPLPIRSTNLGDYRILISRSDRRPNADLYAFSLRQSIPPLPIPLLPTETEPILDLQPLFNYVYEKGRYRLAIDYTQPPKPPLSPEDREWAATLNYPTN